MNRFIVYLTQDNTQYIRYQTMSLGYQVSESIQCVFRNVYSKNETTMSKIPLSNF